MGVRLSETKPETKMAAVMVTANSCSNRPRIPLMNSTGMNTAASESVIEMMVNPISLAPRYAASMAVSPDSMWRTMFSNMTMASSTTNPTDRVRAMSDKLSSEYPIAYMMANVPMMLIGSARLGIVVAERFLKKSKITRITSTNAKNKVNLTSLTESRIDTERS